MKKVVADFIRAFGCETGYSGNARILYIKGDRAVEARQAVRNKWPHALAFDLKITEEIPEEVKEQSSGVKIANEVIAEEKAIETVVMDFNSKEAALILREKIDVYLIANPIDRHAKNPYLAVADLFKVKNDYIRGRWRALREKGLVEKESSNQNA